MTDSDFLQKYIDASIESSDRTRRILLVMIITSILIFVACWNSRAGGWVNLRLLKTRAEVARGEAERGEENTKGRASYVDEAKLQWNQKIRSEQISQIQVPFLGISFDVDDLGMLGGVALVVMLVWVNYSLSHQLTNFRMALSLAEAIGQRDGYGNGTYPLLYYTYQNLAMRQVLTIPPQPGSELGKDTKEPNLWPKVSKVLYALPLLVHCFVVGHDLLTIDLADQYSRNGTIIILVADFLLLWLIAALTILCFRMWKKMYGTWKTVADKI